MAFLQRTTLPARRTGTRLRTIISGIILAFATGYIPVRLTVARWQAPQPQAILTLGGRATREVFTADFARLHPGLSIWVSSGLSPRESRAIFRRQGVADDRLNLDYRALDTVTNFTTLVEDLTRQNIHHIYLITSDYHMARAQAIAIVVLGSHGITFTPIVVPSTVPPEDKLRIVRDVARSLMWLATGYTGADLKFR